MHSFLLMVAFLPSLALLCCRSHGQLLLSKVAPDLQTSKWDFERRKRGEEREREIEAWQGDQCIRGRASRAEPFPCLVLGPHPQRRLMTVTLQYRDYREQFVTRQMIINHNGSMFTMLMHLGHVINHSHNLSTKDLN